MLLSKVSLVVLVNVVVLILAVGQQSISVGVNPGYWVVYQSVFNGPPPALPYPMTYRVDIFDAPGTNVTFQLTTWYSDGAIRPFLTTIDLLQGGSRLFIIPANLAVGQAFQDTEAGQVTIRSVGQRTYLNMQRLVASSTLVKGDTTTVYYWDTVTGFVLEYTTSTPNYSQTVSVIDTNIWKSAGGSPFVLLAFAALALTVIVVIGYRYMGSRSRQSDKARR